MPDRSTLKKLNSFDSEQGCFACGEANPAGLGMQFYTDGETVFSWLRVPGRLCGWRRIVHGGIVSTILDEAMSWSAHHLIRKLILTKSIRVDFLHPLFVESEIRTEGRVLRRNSDREALMEAEIFDDGGKACARAEGTFALLTPKIARRLGFIEEPMIRSFERFFAV